jgi:hypothetical protein
MIFYFFDFFAYFFVFILFNDLFKFCFVFVLDGITIIATNVKIFGFK